MEIETNVVAWIKARTEIGDWRTPVVEAYEDYKAYAEGGWVRSNKAFGIIIRDRGFRMQRDAKQRYYYGLRLRTGPNEGAI